MADLDDFGANTGGSGDFADTDDYEVSYLTDLEIGDKFKGEIFMSDISFSDKMEKDFFAVVITNHDEEEKWVMSYVDPTIVEDGTKLYGRNGSRVFELIDGILSGMFGIEKGEAKYHAVLLDKFREGVNNKIVSVEAEIVENKHPLAKSGMLSVTKVVPVE